MALVFPGKTACGLCGRVIDDPQTAIGFPAFLPPGHRFHRFSDAAFHSVCFRECPEHPEFSRLYDRYREIWEFRPKNLSLKDMESWGRQAFKELEDSTPPDGTPER